MLNVPCAPAQTGRQVFFGQLLVGTPCPPLRFAKELANAVLIHAEGLGVALDYTPSGSAFVTRVEGPEHILAFEGPVESYAGIPLAEAPSFHISFRIASAEDTLMGAIAVHLLPDYVATLSVVASAPAFSVGGFWNDLANCLWTGLEGPGLDGSPAYPDAKIAIIYGEDKFPQKFVRIGN